MAGKYDEPPAYPGPQAPAAAYHGGDNYQHQYNQAYGPPPQGGYYQPNPQMGYPPQGPYMPQQQGYYPNQPYYQQDQRRGPGCLEGMLAALACCCCLDLLF